MLRITALVFGFLFIAGLALADDKDLKKYSGKLKSVTPEKRTFVLIIDGKDWEFLVNVQTKLYGPDKKELKDGLKAACFKPGVSVTANAGVEARIAKEVWCEGEKK